MSRLELIYSIIQKNPAIRFNDVMRLSNLKNGTLTHYIKKLENEKKISVERSPRITRFYDIDIPEKEAEICKLLTRSTIKDIIALLLKHKKLTFPEIKDMTGKSGATISVCLSELFTSHFVNKTYDIPSNQYSLKNPDVIRSVVKVHFPSQTDKFIHNSVELLDF